MNFDILKGCAVLAIEKLHDTFVSQVPGLNVQRNEFGIQFLIVDEWYSYECILGIDSDYEGTGFAVLEYWLWFCAGDNRRFCFSDTDPSLLALCLVELSNVIDFGCLYPCKNDDNSVHTALFKMVEIDTRDFVADATEPPISRVVRYFSRLVQEASSVAEVLGGIASGQILDPTVIKPLLKSSNLNKS